MKTMVADASGCLCAAVVMSVLCCGCHSSSPQRTIRPTGTTAGVSAAAVDVANEQLDLAAEALSLGELTEAERRFEWLVRHKPTVEAFAGWGRSLLRRDPIAARGAFERALRLGEEKTGTAQRVDASAGTCPEPGFLTASPSGLVAVSCAGDASVRVLGVNGYERLRLSAPSLLDGLAVTPTGTMVAMANATQVLVYHGYSGRPLASMAHGLDHVLDRQLRVAWRPIENSWVAATDAAIALLPARGSGPVRTGLAKEWPRSWASAHAVASDGSRLAVGRGDGTIAVWDLEALRPLMLVDTEGRERIMNVTIVGHVLYASQNRPGVPIMRWDLRDGRRLESVRTPVTTRFPDASQMVWQPASDPAFLLGYCQRTPRPRPCSAVARIARGANAPTVAISAPPLEEPVVLAEKNTLVSRCLGGRRVCTWNLDNGAARYLLGYPKITKVVTTAVGSHVATLDEDCTARVWDLSREKLRTYLANDPLRGHRRLCSTGALSISADGQWLAVSYPGWTRFYGPTKHIDGPLASGRTQAAFSPRGMLLARTNPLQVWDISTDLPRRLFEHQDRKDQPHLLMFDLSALLLVLVDSSEVQVLDARSGNTIAALNWAGRDIRELAISGRSRQVAVRDDSGRIWLWRYAEQQAAWNQLRTVPTLQCRNCLMGFAYDGSRLALLDLQGLHQWTTSKDRYELLERPDPAILARFPLGVAHASPGRSPTPLAVLPNAMAYGSADYLRLASSTRGRSGLSVYAPSNSDAAALITDEGRYELLGSDPERAASVLSCRIGKRYVLPLSVCSHRQKTSSLLSAFVTSQQSKSVP